MLLGCMQDSPAANGLVARATSRHVAKSDREASGVLSAALGHTHFLDSPRMTAMMRRSDVAFAALKERTATVFLVLPPDRISTYAQLPAPVLFLLGKFAALGRLEPVERAMGLMAGYELWPILQNLHQLRGAYGTRVGTFLSNAGLVQVFNVNDTDTAEWVSRALGDTTEMYETGSSGENTRPAPALAAGSSSTGTAAHLVPRALLTPMRCGASHPTGRFSSRPARRLFSPPSSATTPTPSSGDCSTPVRSRLRWPSGDTVP
jgi:type IV secretion system protein VirD4